MTPMLNGPTVTTTILEIAVDTLNLIASNATSANPTHKAERAHAFAMEPSSFSCVQGSLPGQDSTTGFPVRSHHLSGLLVGTAVKGELPHLNVEKIVGLRLHKVK
jgi:predicted thioesterase